jgi:hypothetical protein
LIDEVDRELRAWASSIVEDVEVRLAPPQPDSESSASVNLHLLELANGVPTHERREGRPWDVVLAYLVTTAAPDAERAHRLLSRLVVAALQRPNMKVELRQFTPQFWTAFNVAPRPAFVLSCPVALERVTVEAPRIRTPAEIRLGLATTLRGVVVTGDDVPVVRARIELPELNVSTYTDDAGRFELGAVRSGVRPSTVKIRAKGLEETAEGRYDDDRLVVRFEPKEK